MARDKTPQELEAERDVAPTVVRRDRPLRIRGTPRVKLETSSQGASDKFFSKRVAEVTDERQEMEGLLKASVSNKLRDLNNKSLEKTLTAEGITSKKEWDKAQEHREQELDGLMSGFTSDELKLVQSEVEASTVSFMGTGSRHVAKQMHIAGKREYQKLQAGIKDDYIRKSGAYLEGGGKRSDFYKDVQNFHNNNKGVLFEAVAREAKMNGDSLSVIKEKKKATTTGIVEGAIDYNLGNGRYNNAVNIFKDMKDYIDPERHDEIKAKLKRGKEDNEADIAQTIFNNAVSVSGGDWVKLVDYVTKAAGNNASLNREIQKAFNIYKARREHIVEQNRNKSISQVYDRIMENHKYNVPWNTTAREINKTIDDGNASFSEMFPLSKRKEVLNFGLDVYKNKKMITNHKKFSELMYESVNAPRKFMGRNLKDPSELKGLDYETINLLQSRQRSIENDLNKPPPDFMWEPLKWRMEEIADNLPEEQRAPFVMQQYGSIFGLINENKFDANAMTSILRKYDHFEATEKPWFWNRWADSIPGYETQKMKEFRNQLKGRDFRFYKNIELLKKAEGEGTAEIIMLQMQKNHIRRQKAKKVRNPSLLTMEELDNNLATYMAKKGYGKK